MATNSTTDESPWATPQILDLRYGLVVLCVLSQLITVALCWPLWQIRPSWNWTLLAQNSAIGTATQEYVDLLLPVPLLPLLDLPQIPFGWLMIASLVLVLLTPRWGLPIHTAVLLASFVFDQYRMQPQFIANVVLLWGCANLRATDVVRWILVSLWFWAGLHKLLSPDWMGQGSWSLLSAINFYPDQLYDAFAIFVATSEILLGILAIFKPRWAAYLCVALHLGICLYLSPLLRNWNESVLPWNFCTAAVGCWILLHSKPGWPDNRKLQFAAAVLLAYPAGFYLGWVDREISHVLYSDNFAIAMITHREPRDTSNDPPASEQLVPLSSWVDRGVQISGYGGMRVPFPNERRLHLQYFDKVGKPSQKMHLHDPRPWGGDEYFLKQSDGRILQIDAPRFFSASEDEGGGVAIDPLRSLFSLKRNGITLLSRDVRSPVYATTIPPRHYQPAILEQLGELLNLEQIQLKDCPVTDDDLRRLPILYKLRGIGLNGTQVTLVGLRHLLKYPNLEEIYFGNGVWTMADLHELTKDSE